MLDSKDDLISPYVSEILALIAQLHLSSLKRPGQLCASSWLHTELFQAYIRVGKAIVGTQFLQVVCLASIEVVPTFRGRGVLSALLRILEEQGAPLVNAQAILLESILEPRLLPSLLRKGYAIAATNGFSVIGSNAHKVIAKDLGTKL